MMYCTYSPEDNKLRLYSTVRLDKETYEKVKAAGFKWAPKQELFVAPAWTPAREDLLLELCGEIDDEDTSLVQRQEERAERFEEYSDKRGQEANSAHAAVSAIADHIPLGQPILVGHHSERRARRDAEKIQSGMSRAVKLWETSQYWLERAKGAIAHAKYKERPDVRHRRIKGLEAEVRKCQAAYTPADNPPHIIQQQEYCYSTGEYLHGGEKVPHVWCAPKGGRGGSWVPVANLPKIEEHYRRWINHYANRIAYERAMLEEQGGLVAEQYEIAVGGMVLVRGEWLTVTKINKSAGEVVSVTTNSRYVKVKGIEEIKGYKPPTAEQAAQVKQATKLPPLCNYPGAGFVAITQAQWDKIYKDHKGTCTHRENTVYGAHRTRQVMNFCLRNLGHTLQSQWGMTGVYISDAKRKDAPAPTLLPTAPALPIEPDLATLEARAARHEANRAEVKAQESSPFEAMKETLKAGVQVVSSPELFPTPPELAARMVQEAGILSGQVLLEPSAGTGNIVAAIMKHDNCAVVKAIEISPGVKVQLYERFGRGNYNCDVIGADFLACGGELGQFDRVLMNPPFSAEVAHVRHAYQFLKPGGRLVAVMSEGPFFRERDQDFRAWLESVGGISEKLPSDTFQESGTGVNTRLVIIDK